MVSVQCYVYNTYSTSYSREELAKHTNYSSDKVLELVTEAKEVADSSAPNINAQVQGKLHTVEVVLHKFNDTAKERLNHCTG